MDIFKKLTETEEKEFRQWARDNLENLAIFESKTGVWHPVVIDEYEKMKKELNNKIEEVAKFLAIELRTLTSEELNDKDYLLEKVDNWIGMCGLYNEISEKYHINILRRALIKAFVYDKE